jgi:hypothetical protein
MKRKWKGRKGSPKEKRKGDAPTGASPSKTQNYVLGRAPRF